MKQIIIGLSLIYAMGLNAQDKAHRERMYGVAISALPTNTNFEQWHNYVLDTAVAGPGLGSDMKSIKTSFRFGLGGELYVRWNGKFRAGLGAFYNTQKGEATGGSYQMNNYQAVMSFQYYFLPDNSHSPYFRVGAGYSRVHAIMTTNHPGHTICYEKDKEIPEGETRNYFMSGPLAEAGLGYSFLITYDKKNPGPNWKKNAAEIDLMIGANTQFSGDWKSKQGTIEGPPVFNPFCVFAKITVGWGIITEGEVENKGSK